MRPLLPGPADALRDAVLRLGLPPERLTVLAERGAVEALALRGLSMDQIRVLERLVGEGGGEVLSNTNGDSAVLLMPLMTAGMLPMQLAAWSDNAGEVGAAIGAVLMARGGFPPPVELPGFRLEFGRRTLVMGILNVTPDSFAGDGVGDDIAAAVARAELLASEGADIIDIGGESTRPSRAREEVSADVEIERVLPVIRELAGRLTVPMSIDTRKAAVAGAALDAGAVIVNDVWGLRGDPRMAEVIAAHPGTGVVAMHNQVGTEYGDLLEDVCLGLRESLGSRREGRHPELPGDHRPGLRFRKDPGAQPRAHSAGSASSWVWAMRCWWAHRESRRRGCSSARRTRRTGSNRALRSQCFPCRREPTSSACTTWPRLYVRCALPMPWFAARPRRCASCRSRAPPDE